MRSRLENLIKGADGYLHITFKTRENFVERFDELKGSDVDIEIEKKFEKRSSNANAYCWVLCRKIAEKMSDDGVIFTEREVYREAVRDVGVWRDIPVMNEGIDTIRTAWERHGIAWLTDFVDYIPGGALIRFYYGSSEYNTKQMKRLLDCLIQECDTLGIEHRTPDEINNLLSLWKQERDK